MTSEDFTMLPVKGKARPVVRVAQTWQYKFVANADAVVLDTLGRDGWEAVGFYHDTVLCKRPLGPAF